MSLVLIADDDNAARVQLKRLLEKAGHKVVESATARQALEEATEHEPDLILLDIHLPGKDPLELLEEIRAESSAHAQFTTDQTVYRIIERVDGRPWLQSAITPNQGSNTLSPFVTLQTRS